MKLSDFSKEQKIYLLIGGTTAIALVGVVLFLIQFNSGSVAQTRTELNDLDKKNQSAERELARRSKMRSDFGQSIVALQGYLEKVPPARNFYSWATEAIYVSARTVGLDVASIEPVKSSVSARDKKSLHLEAYSLRITASGSYDTITRFAQEFTMQQPFVRFSGIEVSARTTPDAHDVRIEIQWPLRFEEFALLEGGELDSAPVVVTEPAGQNEQSFASSSPKPEKNLVKTPVIKPVVAESKKSPLSSPPLEKSAELSVSKTTPVEKALPPVVSSGKASGARSVSDEKLISLLEQQSVGIDDTLDSFFDDFEGGMGNE